MRRPQRLRKAKSRWRIRWAMLGGIALVGMLSLYSNASRHRTQDNPSIVLRKHVKGTASQTEHSELQLERTSEPVPTLPPQVLPPFRIAALLGPGSGFCSTQWLCDPPDQIPNILHHIYLEGNAAYQLAAEASQAVFRQEWREGCMACYPHWEHMFWDQDSGAELIRDKYDWLWPYYNSLQRNISRANVLKYVVMHAHGGLYLDLDVECFRAADDMLRGYSAVLQLDRGQDVVGTSVLASAPAWQLWEAVIGAVAESGAGDVEADPSAHSGPGALSQQLAAWSGFEAGRLAGLHTISEKEVVMVYGVGDFFQACGAGDAGCQLSVALARAAGAVPPGLAGHHRWAASWDPAAAAGQPPAANLSEIIVLAKTSAEARREAEEALQGTPRQTAPREQQTLPHISIPTSSYGVEQVLAASQRCQKEAPCPTATIPHIMHMVFLDGEDAYEVETRGAKPAFRREWRQACIVHHPHWRHMFWDLAAAERLLAERYRWFLPIFRSYRRVVTKGDALRYFILHAYGGVYLDLDVECLRNWEASMNGYSMVVQGTDPGSEHVTNAVIAGVPGSPIWEHVFETLVAMKIDPENSAEDDPVFQTGPAVLNTALRKFIPESTAIVGEHTITEQGLKVRVYGLRDWATPCFWHERLCHLRVAVMRADGRLPLNLLGYHRYSGSWNNNTGRIVNPDIKADLFGQQADA